MYKTDAYARIQCTLCGNREVDVLMPGQVFTSIKQCECQSAPKAEAQLLEDMTVIGLKKMLQEKGIAYGSKDTKPQLIAAIRALNV